MLKDVSNKEKVKMIIEWFPLVCATTRKEIKNEHLKKDWSFAKKYFSGKDLNKVTADELSSGYLKAIEEEPNGSELAELLFNNWLLKHSDVYYFFEEELKRISPDFTNLQEIELDAANALANKSIQQFGALKSYLFSVINSVVYPKAVYDRLYMHAQKETVEKANHAKMQQEETAAQTTQLSHEQEIARLTDKYEKKLQGMQKKYNQDVLTLKKQIALLQRKLSS